MSGFGVYVHWPYCATLCPYCDFNIYRARGADADALVDAVVADIAAHAARTGPRTVDTIFLGGGTPSLLSGADVARIVDAVAGAYALHPDVEISLEANPEDWARFADHAAAGVNRFSIGAQALDDPSLATLGRRHDAAASVRAVEAAARTGRRVSVDLIYARAGQTVSAWEAELRRALVLPAEHFSLYQLTIEPGTAFGRAHARGALAPPDDALAATLFEATQTLTADAGAPAYEISNHARHDAARARHNILYWTGADWIGVGPGAHGRLTLGERLATTAALRPADYVARVREKGLGWASCETLAPDVQAEELILSALRYEGGLDRARAEALRGRPLPDALKDFLARGLVAEEGGRLRIAPAGWLLADHIAMALAS